MIITKFEDFKLFEDDCGGGGMGAVCSPTVGAVPGAVWGSDSGEAGSGDIAAVDLGTHFGTVRDVGRKRKKGKKRRKQVVHSEKQYPMSIKNYDIFKTY